MQHPFRAIRGAVGTRIAWLILCLGFGIACLLLVFRPFWKSHFDLILSDPVDGRFSIAILEHWRNVLSAQAQMNSPNFFFPEKGMLGYSEAFFLLALPFAVLRRFGLDRYLAFQFTMMLLSAFGFASVIYLLRMVLRFTRSTALLGACLFTIFNIYYMHFVHPQLAAVVFVPLLVVLAVKFWQLKDSQPGPAKLCLCAGASLASLLLFTSFYIGWFALLFAAMAILSGLMLSAISMRSFECLHRSLTDVRRHKMSFFLAFISFAISLVPFLIVYMPALRQTGKRSFAECLFFLQPPSAVLDTGPNNLLWGKFSERIEHHNFPHGIPEHPTGWPVITLTFFILSAGYAVHSALLGRRRVGKKDDLTISVSAVAVSCVFLVLLGMRFGTHAPFWKIVWSSFPGAAAIRVPQRINLVISIGVLIVCMFGFEKLKQRLALEPTIRSLTLGIMGIALLAEQINFMPTHLISRQAEFRKFAGLASPPKQCREFYVVHASNERFAILAAQTDAMLVAEQLKIPTLNGYSGWFPPGWKFLLPASPAVDAERAREWAHDHGIESGLCSLDVSSGTWLPVAITGADESFHLIRGAIGNSSFEASSLVSWRQFGSIIVEVSSERSHSGTRSLAEQAGAGSVYEDVTGLEPGRNYIVSAWVEATPKSTAKAMIGVFEPSTRIAIYSKQQTPGPDWQRLSESVNADDLGRIRVHLFRTPGTGTIYWDDVTLYGVQ